MRRLSLSTTAAAVLTLACAAPGAALAAQDAGTAALLAQIKQLTARIEALEQQNKAVDKALDSERISEKEPEIVTRLKAVELQSLGMLKSARTVEALDGIQVGFALSTVAQRPSSAVHMPGTDLDGRFGNSQLNYRGDAFVTVPLDKLGDVESKVFAHIRFGQGSGLNDMYSFSKPNATAFRVTSTAPDDSVAILGQAWYQATIPLPWGGFKPQSKETLEVNFGKMDPFLFFDQNAAANDETRQFLNTAFVHNPLLDAGGDIGVDRNGFTPGFRVSYLNKMDKREPWRLSLGVFGAGNGANYSRFFSSPLILAQAETQLRLMGGLQGNYRLYYWRTGQAPTFTGGSAQRAGWGLSIDQRVGDALTLFGRWGQHTQGAGARFDKALTAGFELAGYGWKRGGDSLGLALGWLQSSPGWRADSASLPGEGGLPAYGYAATGAERVAEAYYRWRLNKQFELTPSLQYLGRPGANPDAKPYYLLSLRAQLTY
ncbi:MAG: carbohydrate porin [Proteobacteria bacterium]|nr:carbohydrate porin [Pseudomonadota bacterium]